METTTTYLPAGFSTMDQLAESIAGRVYIAGRILPGMNGIGRASYEAIRVEAEQLPRLPFHVTMFGAATGRCAACGYEFPD